MIEGIFYSEFDNNAGPIIRFQDPPGFVDAEDFDYISEYIITKSVLCFRSIIISTPHAKKVMGYPVQIEHKRYLRNSILFNVCFIFSASEKSLERYKPVVKKLAEVFRDLEMESGYLYHDMRKKELLSLLPRVREELNAHQKCYVPVGDTHAIALCIFPKIPPAMTCSLQSSAVPLETEESSREKVWEEGHSLLKEDIGLHAVSLAVRDQVYTPGKEQLIPLQKICDINQIDPALTCSAVQVLQVCGLVSLIPVFHYESFYAVTDRIGRLLESADKQAVLEYVRIQPEEINSGELISRPADWNLPSAVGEMDDGDASADPQTLPSPDFMQLFCLYNHLSGSVPYLRFVQTHQPGKHYIHERRLIVFGLVSGLVRKLGT